VSRRLVIDPVTRVQGHLRVTCDLERSGGGWVVRDAFNTATLFRGIEETLKGRDPRDAVHVASRICGVCPTPHAFNAAKAVETAFGIGMVPNNARLVRNMMEASQIVYDHLLWFYQLNLVDYVDVEAVVRDARPTQPSLRRLQKTLGALRGQDRIGPFAAGPWGHPAYAMPADEGLELLGHYLQALEVQSLATQAAAILGGKFPMAMNYAPGGVTHLPQLPEIIAYRSRMADAATFIDEVMLPDLALLLEHYGEQLARSGRGVRDYLSWGVLDGESQSPADRLFPRGVLRDGLPASEPVDPTQVRLWTGRSWYPDGLGRGKQPLDVGQSPVEFTRTGDVAGKYDWTRAVRLGDAATPMETGPLAQVLLAYAARRRLVVSTLDGVMAALPSLSLPDALLSDLGRMVCRVVKAKVAAAEAVRSADLLARALASRDRDFLTPSVAPDAGEGSAGWDGPRGALCHWVRIRKGVIDSYAVVAPSNWNLSPRDDAGVPGPLEQALAGTKVADPDRPLEILRTVHAFDPCMACAVHVLRPSRKGQANGMTRSGRAATGGRS
jgi:Ni,Fe-hydrogenase I large subunit